MLIKDLMRRDYISIDPDQTIIQVIKLFAKYEIYEAPIVKDGVLLGIVSDKQIAKAMVKKELFKPIRLRSADKLKSILASDIMDKHCFVLNPNANILDVLIAMSKRKMNIIPVVELKERKQMLIGIVTGKDIIRHFAVSLIKTKIARRGGDEIKSIIDSFVAIVREKKKVNLVTIAKRLNIRKCKAEEIAKTLESHNLVKIEYTLTGNIIVRDVDA